MAEMRPSPDELLARIKAEEEQKKKGKLTIFLGYAAGVGKTYAMLEVAQQRKKEVDLVAAYVETHGRAETESLLKGLEIIPRKQTEYRGIHLTEIDLDAVLARRPQLVLVDELAHTNAPGSRHPKRYQDVEELLDAGIDVYTTLNAQHVESARDKVAQITSAWVRETVPDTIVDRAMEIRLVDLPPDELIRRLKEGKVYVPEQILHATTEFFRKGNLTALREVTMRLAAEHVDKQMRVYMQTHTISGPWPAAERLLACISPGPLGKHMVRNARILASQLNAEWFAVYVETPDSVRLSSAQQDRLANTLRFAQRLGAKTLKLQGQSVAQTVTEYASTHNITKIIVGKPQQSHWQELLRGSVTNKIIRQSKYIDVYVITGAAEPFEQEKTPARQSSRRWWGYLLGLGTVFGATLLGALVHTLFDPANLIMLYLLSVVISAIYFGLGPSILVSVLGVLAFDFFLVPPSFTFAVADTQYIFTFIALLVVGIVISYLTAQVRSQIETARRHEAEMATLYDLSKDIAVTVNLEATINAIIKHVEETLGLTAAIFIPDSENKGGLKPYIQKRHFTIDENDVAVAFWAFQHQQTAGYGTDTLPDNKARYLPLNTTRGAVGVMGIWLANTTQPLTIERTRLLEAFANLAAMGIERAQLKVQG